ncbi:MAG: hypothetical protein R2737_10360 [Candidatus Nanopelagicales bacterium]
MTTTVALPDPWETPTVPVPEGGRLLGYGRTAAYEAADRGELPTIQTGSRKRRVPVAAIYELLGLPLPQRPDHNNPAEH